MTQSKSMRMSTKIDSQRFEVTDQIHTRLLLTVEISIPSIPTDLESGYLKDKTKQLEMEIHNLVNNFCTDANAKLEKGES